MKNDKGITMVSLVITIIVMAIISSAMIYNSRNNVYINQINELYADIQTLNRKVDEYYVKYGELPVICEFKTADVDNSLENNKNNLEAYLREIAIRNEVNIPQNAVIVNPNDGNEYYVLDLNILDSLSLNFGCYEEYNQVKENRETTTDPVHAETDIYIINGLTHQIYYLAGVFSDDNMYSSYDLEKTSAIIDKPEEWLQPNGLFRTAGSVPYLPEGFSPSREKDEIYISDGLVVKDRVGNEYVWVPVPNDGTGPDYAVVADETEDSEEYYTEIYNALIAYVGGASGTIRNNTSYSDNWTDENAAKPVGDGGGLGLATTGDNSYSGLKKKMLKSIYTNGGFYIGRFETGYTGTKTTVNARIQQNLRPYASIDCGTAQAVASSFSSGSYTSSLMFGIQWDLVLKFIVNNAGKNIANSTSWGNYINAEFTIDRGEYRNAKNQAAWAYDGSWKPYTEVTEGAVDVNHKKIKNNDSNATYQGSVLLSTGAADRNKVLNIYDIAGNVWEWTLEYGSNTSYLCVCRGGCFNVNGSNNPARNRNRETTSSSGSTFGFRVSLY